MQPLCPWPSPTCRKGTSLRASWFYGSPPMERSPPDWEYIGHLHKTLNMVQALCHLCLMAAYQTCESVCHFEASLTVESLATFLTTHSKQILRKQSRTMIIRQNTDWKSIGKDLQDRWCLKSNAFHSHLVFRLLPPLGILKNLDGWPVLFNNDSNQNMQAINLKVLFKNAISLKTWRQARQQHSNL